MSSTYRLIYMGKEYTIAVRVSKELLYLVSDIRKAIDSLKTLLETLDDRRTRATHYFDICFDAGLDFEALKALFNLPWFRDVDHRSLSTVTTDNIKKWSLDTPRQHWLMSVPAIGVIAQYLYLVLSVLRGGLRINSLAGMLGVPQYFRSQIQNTAFLPFSVCSSTRPPTALVSAR